MFSLCWQKVVRRHLSFTSLYEGISEMFTVYAFVRQQS
jgi:hypothetical protein